jgi:hypothetical protein
MELIHYRVKGNQLRDMPEDQLVILVQFSHLINCIAIFHKLLIYTSTDYDDKVKEQANVAQRMLIARIHAGVLVEGWRVLTSSFFTSSLSGSYGDRLSDLGKTALKELKQYFSSSNLLTEVRNRHSFHFDRKAIIDYLPNIENDSEYDIYLSESQGNSLLYLAEEVCNMALIRTCKEFTKSAEEVQALKSFYDQLLEISRHFFQFVHEVISCIIYDHLDKNGEYPTERISLLDLENIRDPKIPFFVEK